jgi:hypothetical protein
VFTLFLYLVAEAKLWYILDMDRRLYTPDEVAQLGDEIFDRVVAPRTTPQEGHLFVAIDVETGDFEIDRSELTAAHRVRARNPGAQLWLRRVGAPYLHQFSPRIRPQRERPV